MTTERLQKLLARAGIASRRKAEDLITAGRVKVGGRVVTELGAKADPRRDRVEVDGRRIVADPLVYVLLNKPKNVMCTLRDPEGRPTVADSVRGLGVRVVPVGRLDFGTSGVLLLTNDGDFANGLMHPRCAVPKVYVVKVDGELDERAVARWRESLVIDGRATRPATVRALRREAGKTWLELTLVEGRNRQVRRLGEAAGQPVMRLARTSYAGITAEGLRPGQWRHLTATELRELKRSYGVPERVRAAPPGAVRVRAGGGPARPASGAPPRGARATVRPPDPRRRSARTNRR
ncbi:MAG: pseudouridine synthase [Sorangiineae bacterium]|nr:pseudouridine synthase [Polyangiaceae bacterium]MEB2321378.1 pseudouridine synthase [Sorangiineae bacterium]